MAGTRLSGSDTMPRGSTKLPRGPSPRSPASRNPHERANLQPGETVLDLGKRRRAGRDPTGSRFVGPTGRVIGVDLNPSMCLKAQAHAAATGTTMECHEGRMEEIPLPDAFTDVVISNGVINLSFRKRKVVEDVPGPRGRADGSRSRTL